MRWLWLKAFIDLLLGDAQRSIPLNLHVIKPSTSLPFSSCPSTQTWVYLNFMTFLSLISFNLLTHRYRHRPTAIFTVINLCLLFFSLLYNKTYKHPTSLPYYHHTIPIYVLIWIRLLINRYRNWIPWLSWYWSVRITMIHRSWLETNLDTTR